MSRGYVYVLSNDAMPGLVKIGRTTRTVAGRASELYQTGVPFPFKVEYELFSHDCADLEEKLHHGLAEYRVNGDREFFRVDPAHVRDIVELMHAEAVHEWLAEFMPDHMAVHFDACVDGVRVHMLSRELDCDYLEIISALGELTAEEVAPALARWKAKCAARIAAKQETAKVIRLG